ncbi:MAG TPA: HDOD domain-containing protein [Desulfotignum sp.]|nr:HDOD domain-containing protein [Desulfotignum sp.]
MQQSLYRIVLKQLNLQNTEPFLAYLVRELQFSREKAAAVIAHHPAIVCDTPHKERAGRITKQLRAMNASVSVSRVIEDDQFPFHIDELQLKWISKLFNMTLRAGVDTAMVYVVVDQGDNTDIPRSLLGKEGYIENAFRDSDSVYVIEDNKVLVFGFTTDTSGLKYLVPKIGSTIKELVDKTARIKVGEAVFPKDGHSFSEMIQVALTRLQPYADSLHAPGAILESGKADEGPAGEGPAETTRTSVLKAEGLLFKHARGRLFRKLLAMDQQVIWAGLSTLPISAQRKFYSRLPFNSPLIPFLSGKIKTQTPSAPNNRAGRTIKEFALKSDIEKQLIHRKNRQSDVISKLNRVESLTTIPSVALQLYNLTMDPDTEIDDIKRIIAVDQVLTLKILKLVNSAFYGLARKVSSVKEASIILGRDEIMNLAFGLSLSKAFTVSHLDGLFDPKLLWHHSIETALVGQYLCQNKKAFSDQGIFTACILHDFGKIFLIDHFPEEYGQIITWSNQTGLPVHEFEEEVFGYNHGVVGGLIVRKWNLPESLVHAISFHHLPSSSASHTRLAAITGLADYLADMAHTDDQESCTNGTPGLQKDHMDVLTQGFEDVTIGSIAERITAVGQFLKENNQLVHLIS